MKDKNSNLIATGDVNGWPTQLPTEANVPSIGIILQGGSSGNSSYSPSPTTSIPMEVEHTGDNNRYYAGYVTANPQENISISLQVGTPNWDKAAAAVWLRSP